MYWAADRIGGPVGKTKCTEAEELSENAVLAHGPGLLPAGPSGKVAREAHGPPGGRSLEVKGPLWDVRS